MSLLHPYVLNYEVRVILSQQQNVHKIMVCDERMLFIPQTHVVIMFLESGESDDLLAVSK